MKQTPNEIMMSGPLPGENFTSDPKNQPWHRPPKFTELDEAVEYSFQKLLDKKRSHKVITALEMGVSVVQLTDIYLTTGISQGKWTPDFAMLMAGPVAHIIKLMADGYGIKYKIGIEDEEKIVTANFFKTVDRLKKPKDLDQEAIKDEVLAEVEQSPEGGLGKGFL